MKYVSILAGVLLLAFFSFAAGMWARERNMTAWQVVADARDAVRSYRRTGYVLPDRTFAGRVNPDASRHVVHHAAGATPGYWLINRFDAQALAFRTELLDQDGAVLHSWPIDYSKLVEGGHVGEFVHVSTVLPDGHLLVNFDDGTALARLDQCAEPVWVRDDFTFHHSIEPDEAGGFWTWAGQDWDGAIDQYMLRFDADTGETLESISLRDDVLSIPANRLQMTFPEGFDLVGRGVDPAGTDFLHPNDLEPLTTGMAATFPQFEAGDLLVSFRNTHMVAVIDRQSHQLLWSAFGPWRDQHDPDFAENGEITVYSNNQYRFRSSILAVTPGGGDARDIFEGGELRFDSYLMGKSQALPGGNMLITSSMEGRVIEVTPSGEIVREYNNIINDRYNALVTYAEWRDADYFSSPIGCSR